MGYIWFDMDGTIADLYGVDSWLNKLSNCDASPYREAAVMHNMSLLARYLNMVQKAGYSIGIISWLSKESTIEYDEAVTIAKESWLEKHLHSVHWNEINIVAYGTPKEDFIEDDDILFDDNEDIRAQWSNEGGRAYEPNQIFEILKSLLEGD